jgi:hypothetical protein
MSKKFKIVISSICALTCAAFISVHASAASFLTGDLDGDGNVTTEDALLILQNVAGIINEFPVDNQNSQGDIVAVVTTDDQSKEYTYNDLVALSTSLKYPVVEVPDNPTATKAINQSLQSIKLQSSVIDELYNETLTAWDDGASKTQCCSYDISYEVKRNSNILSLTVVLSKYYIGAQHGNYGTQTFNFDLTTGSLITIRDLVSVNELNYFIYNCAAPCVYKEVKGYGFVSSESDVAGYIDENWYIDENDELIYVFNPYELAAYAMGTISVSIDGADSYIVDYYKGLLS